MSGIARFVITSVAAALQHIEAQQPPDEEDGDDCACDVNDPVARCFRAAKIEHDGIVARGRKCDRQLAILARHKFNRV
jgi:hypothetical protein